MSVLLGYTDSYYSLQLSVVTPQNGAACTGTSMRARQHKGIYPQAQIAATN